MQVVLLVLIRREHHIVRCVSNLDLINFSEYRKHYLGEQFLPEKMGNLDIGPKEATGPVRNEYGYTQSFDDPRRFITSYQIK